MYLHMSRVTIKLNYYLNICSVKYNPNFHPGITHEFQTAAMRFGHTLVTPGTYVRDANCRFTTLSINIQGQPDKAHAIRLCNAYWNSQVGL